MENRASVAFRALIVAYVVLLIMSILVGQYLEDDFTAAVYKYRSSIHPGLNVSYTFWSLLIVTYTVALLISLIGMWFFWNPSRWLIIAALTFGYSIGYIVGIGPIVRSHISGDILFVGNLCLGGAIALSFFSSVASQFKTMDGESNVT